MSRESGQVLDVRISVLSKISPVCLLQIESSAKGNCSRCDNCIDSEAYIGQCWECGIGSRLLALVSNVVGNKHQVSVVSTSPPTAVKGVGELCIMYE